MIRPDPKYNNAIISKFINHVMRNGKKFLAQRIVYGAFSKVQERTNKNPLEVFNQALKNVSPRMKTKPTRVGGATYQVPIPLKPKQQMSLAMRWIIEAARKRKGKKMEDKLADELILAAKNEGTAVKKRINTERMAEANKAFAHFAS